MKASYDAHLQQFEQGLREVENYQDNERAMEIVGLKAKVFIFIFIFLFCFSFLTYSYIMTTVPP